jgi:hypothetical protein
MPIDLPWWTTFVRVLVALAYAAPKVVIVIWCLRGTSPTRGPRFCEHLARCFAPRAGREGIQLLAAADA